MSETPPYANYPRAQANRGSSESLRNLSDGYFGLGTVFVVDVLITVTFSTCIKMFLIGLTTCYIGLAFMVLIIATLTYGPNKKIGQGAHWSPAQPVIASVLMGLNSALCCGVIGYVVMQQIAANHMKRYDLHTGFFGLKRREVERKIYDLEVRERAGQA